MMMHFNLDEIKSTKFSIDSYDLLNKYYVNYSSDIHDLNLTNLTIWRNKHQLQALEIEGYLWYQYTVEKKSDALSEFETMFSEPVGDYADTDALIHSVRTWIHYAHQNQLPLKMRHIGQAMKERLETAGFQMTVTPIEDDFDYVYETENLNTLAGNKYHKKKNHLNQFRKRYTDQIEVEPINTSNATTALEAARNWCIANGCKESMDLCQEFQGIKEILSNWHLFEERGLVGMMIRIDKQPIAISLGEKLSDDTFLVHIEKADASFQGAYTAINQSMAEHVASKYPFINREQDMGIEGIRKAKLSYYPHHLVEKYDITIHEPL